LQKNPLGKVPVLETKDGCIAESNAIARYVARLDSKTHLFGSSDYEAALVEQWIDFAVTEIELPAKIWLYPIFGFMENNQTATNKAKGDIRKILEILNEHLQDHTYLVGESITLADIVVGLHLLHLFTTVLDPGFRKPFGNVIRWFTTLVHQPNWSSVVGEVTLATKMAQAPKGEKAHHEQEKQEKHEKHEKHEKQEKHDKQEPKEEKKEAPNKEESKPKKKKKDDDDDDDDVVDEEVKLKNPLDALPPSPFNLDEWKRFYSNNDGTKSTAWFWEHLDSEGWSLWLSEFKYNEENESLLKTCNYLGGWFQRLDKLRKYGFGNALILKSLDDKFHEISAVWLIRGKEIPKEVTDCDDTEHFKWTKLEADSAETKQLVNEYWTWEGKFGGKVFVQGRVYK